ncbi:MAG: STAS domain-containing protein [Chloroflexus sp.]
MNKRSRKGVVGVNTEQVDDVLIIQLPARLDAAGVAAIESDLASTITGHGGKVLADMTNVNFVASLALRMLLSNLRAIQPLGGDLRLYGLQPQIAEIFRKSRFDTLFKIYPDRETALAAYRNR